MIQNRLLSWYRKNKRLLPFRDRTEPYIIWLVEIMLQQTQVETVIPYFNKWIHQFPTLQNVA
ncbi:MAG: A/G-specific adenine glycosylase, partial [Candidatus Marinimicrobia bacterium]|nr:A/G-specific adenine glycosylase [Candidatus Neomarinimicrobiota bacterium]